MTNSERRADVMFYMRRLVAALVAILALSFFGHKALAQMKKAPTAPVWVSSGIMCDTEEQVIHFLDERYLPFPIPEGCIVVQQEIIMTVELSGTYEANGFVYKLATYTVGGYRVKTPYGWDFIHFYTDGKLILYTRYGYWDKTKIEDVEPEGKTETEDEPDTKPEPVGQRI